MNMIFTNRLNSIIAVFIFTVLYMACGEDTATTKKSEAKTATTAVPATKKTVATPTTASTSGKVTILGKEVKTNSGEDFCMDVKVANFVDVISMQYSTNWDTKALQYKGVKNFVLKDLNAQNFGRAKKEENTLRLSWFAQDLKGVTLFDGSTIYQVCFQAIGKSGTTTEVEFANQPMVAEIANSKMQTLPTDLKKVKVVIE